MMEKTLPEVCIIQYGFPFDSSKFCSADGVPLVRIRDVVRGYSETYTTEIAGENYIVNDGDLLIGMDGEFNIAYWKGGRAYLNQRVCRLIPREDVDRDYIFYYMPQALKAIEDATPFVTVKHLSAKQLSKILIPLPDMSEQQRISAVLRSVDRVIAMRKKELDELTNLVKSRFIELFGVYPSNPKGWETATIRDIVADVRYGSSRPAVDGGKYPYLRMNNITYGGELDLTDTKRIDIPDNELDKCTVRRGDVLFNRTNSKELVGKTCVYNRDEMMVLAGFVIRVRVTERVLPEFLSAFLNTDFSKQMLLGMCKAAIGQANINAQEMQNIGIYLPPTELQRQFVQFKEQTDKSKLAVQKGLQELEILKKSLMQQYFG